MRDDKLVELLTDAYAAAAMGRLVTHDTVTRTAANVLFSALVEPLVPREAFAGYPAAPRPPHEPSGHGAGPP